MLGRLVDSQDNQLRHQKLEMEEQEKGFKQEMELKELEVKGLKKLMEKEQKDEQEKHSQEMKEMVKRVKELKELMDTGMELKVKHNAEVHKLQEENKVLKSHAGGFNSKNI